MNEYDLNELKHELEEMTDLIGQAVKKNYGAEVRAWMMAATIRIWSGNKLCAEEYPRILKVFSTTPYTLGQIITALDCAGEPYRRLVVPEFFQDVVRVDQQFDSSMSRTLADLMCRILANAALANGDFTIEEAHLLKEISDMLIHFCDCSDVAPGLNPENHPELITPLNPIGYYQAETTEDQASVPVSSGHDIKTTNSDSFPTPTTHINIGSTTGSPTKQNKGSADDLVIELSTEDMISQESEVGVSVKQPVESGQTESLESVLAELNGLVGLDKVKQDVQSLLNFIRICQLRNERGMKVPTISYHLVFTGNPGTGKTTVARLVARLYYLLGLLPEGQLVETDRSGLVAGYMGQTAIKTQKVIQQAIGGVLFIDEAYSLVNDEQDSYGKEAIETLLKAMEDHRDELVVIVAGYDDLMHQFIESNPGLRSRFNKYFHFPDYNGEDLLKILRRFCDSNGYKLCPDTLTYLKEELELLYLNREAHFGNARAIRNLFEKAINHQANRLAANFDITDEELAELTLEDIRTAREELR